MKDIAFHITDIAENSVRAGADTIRIMLSIEGSILTLTIADNGCGMDEQTLRRVTDPFCTTRTTRRVGLGLPFLFQNAEQCGGHAWIRSAKNGGTEVTASFLLDNIDCPPPGDVGQTLMQIITGNPNINTAVTFSCDGKEFALSTVEICEALDGLSISHPHIAQIIREMLDANISDVFGQHLGGTCRDMQIG